MMSQNLVQDIVDMLTRRTFATTEAWSPIVGVLLTFLAATVHIGGSGVSNDIAVATPMLAGLIVSWVAVARKSATAKWLHDHLEPSIATASETSGASSAIGAATPSAR